MSAISKATWENVAKRLTEVSDTIENAQLPGNVSSVVDVLELEIQNVSAVLDVLEHLLAQINESD